MEKLKIERDKVTILHPRGAYLFLGEYDAVQPTRILKGEPKISTVNN